MQKKMENKEFNFVVLMDFSQESYRTLKYVLSLAKFIRLNIRLVHIVNPSDMVDSDNQVVAQRSIEATSKRIENKLKSLIELIEEAGVVATYEYSVGNIVRELEKMLRSYDVNVLVIGKKKQNPSFSGMLTKALFKVYSGPVLIVSEEIEFHEDTKIAIGLDSETWTENKLQLIIDLCKQTNFKLMGFAIRDVKGAKKEIKSLDTLPTPINPGCEIQFEFIAEENVVPKMEDKIARSKIELLCIGRQEDNSKVIKRLFRRNNVLQNIIEKVNVPLLIVGCDAKNI